MTFKEILKALSLFTFIIAIGIILLFLLKDFFKFPDGVTTIILLFYAGVVYSVWLK